MSLIARSDAPIVSPDVAIVLRQAGVFLTALTLVEEALVEDTRTYFSLSGVEEGVFESPESAIDWLSERGALDEGHRSALRRAEEYRVGLGYDLRRLLIDADRRIYDELSALLSDLRDIVRALDSYFGPIHLARLNHIDRQERFFSGTRVLLAILDESAHDETSLMNDGSDTGRGVNE